MLTRLGKEDPEGKKHICKLLSHFEYKGHLCMVFQPMEMNLRKLLKTYGREVGITLSAIRTYARQMFHGLLHMQRCHVLHGDIKLDNILISKDLKSVAICDFGTADWTHEATITPYMVSRYYRPPEICLGLKYSHAMDLWSVGVCLFELYTGKFMFTGRNNNEMLKQFMVSARPAPSPAFWLAACRRVLCLAHLLRDLLATYPQGCPGVACSRRLEAPSLGKLVAL